MDGRTHRRRQNYIPPTSSGDNKILTICWGIFHVQQEMCHNVTNAPKDTIFLEFRPEVKVTVTQRQYVTLQDPKMYTSIKFGILISNNTGDMLRTRIRLRQTDARTGAQTVQKLYAPEPTLGA